MKVVAISAGDAHGVNIILDQSPIWHALHVDATPPLFLEEAADPAPEPVWAAAAAGQRPGQLQQPANGPSPTLSLQSSAPTPPAMNRQVSQEQWLQREELAHEQLDAQIEASVEALERLLANGVPVRVRERRLMGVEMKWLGPWRTRTRPAGGW